MRVNIRPHIGIAGEGQSWPARCSARGVQVLTAVQNCGAGAAESCSAGQVKVSPGSGLCRGIVRGDSQQPPRRRSVSFKRRLGHAQISVTMDSYSHVLPGMQREAAVSRGRGLFIARSTSGPTNTASPPMPTTTPWSTTRTPRSWPPTGDSGLSRRSRATPIVTGSSTTGTPRS